MTTLEIIGLTIAFCIMGFIAFSILMDVVKDNIENRKALDRRMKELEVYWSPGNKTPNPSANGDAILRMLYNKAIEARTDRLQTGHIDPRYIGE